MPAKFLEASFQFEPNFEVPEHEDGIVTPADEIDPTLWRLQGYDGYERAPYHIAINIEDLAFAGILAEAWERKNGEQATRLARGSIRDQATIIHPTEGEFAHRRAPHWD